MELEQIYGIFDESRRLNTTKAGSVEFLTTTRFIDRCLPPNGVLLDIGAGTGAYSLHYAGRGCAVTAVEPVEGNLTALRAGIAPGMAIEAVRGNALDLSRFADGSFDVVLCLGPLYHLHTEAERRRCAAEAMRVCKPGGHVFFAYISNDMVFVTEAMLYNPNALICGEYDRTTFKMTDEPFVFLTPDTVEGMMQGMGVKKAAQFAADGLAELLGEKINAFDDAQFSEWLRFHWYTCEKPELLGYSNHIVYVAQK